jgi:hypothetical protein
MAHGGDFSKVKSEVHVLGGHERKVEESAIGISIWREVNSTCLMAMSVTL